MIKNEPKLSNKEDVIGKLKPFWERYGELEGRFREEVGQLEKEMTKAIGMNIDLEFFHVDEGCVGIGASNIQDKDTFPLIQDSELR